MMSVLTIQGRRRGFTIIEMGLAVMAFMLLLSIVLITVNKQQSFRRDVNRTANMNQVSKALALYVSEYGSYPSAKLCLTGKDAVMQELIDKKYFEAGQMMQDPRWLNDPEYCYLYEGNGSTYSIRYYLETDRQAEQGFHYIRP